MLRFTLKFGLQIVLNDRLADKSRTETFGHQSYIGRGTKIQESKLEKIAMEQPSMNQSRDAKHIGA